MSALNLAVTQQYLLNLNWQPQMLLRLLILFTFLLSWEKEKKKKME